MGLRCSPPLESKRGTFPLLGANHCVDNLLSIPPRAYQSGLSHEREHLQSDPTSCFMTVGSTTCWAKLTLVRISSITASCLPSTSTGDLWDSHWCLPHLYPRLDFLQMQTLMHLLFWNRKLLTLFLSLCHCKLHMLNISFKGKLGFVRMI
jgi:hypothetical protein